jgi:hypothetical protein
MNGKYLRRGKEIESISVEYRKLYAKFISFVYNNRIIKL